MNALKNKVQLIGRLGKNPEIYKFEDGNKVAKFSLAIDESYKTKEGKKIEKTNWFTIILRNGLVNVAENYLEKGKQIAVEGRLNNRSWEDKNGNRQYATEIECNELLML